MHGAGVHVHVVQRYVGIILRDLDHATPPQLRGLEHVGFVHRGNFFPSLPCLLEGDARHALDLHGGITHSVVGVILFFAEAAGMGEVKTAQEFADDEHVCAFHPGTLQWRAISDRREESCRTQVGKASQHGP